MGWRNLKLEPLLDQLQADAAVAAGDENGSSQHLASFVTVTVTVTKLRSFKSYFKALEMIPKYSEVRRIAWNILNLYYIGNMHF